ncbi:phage portal protein [uncultured Maricaulis sp.]|uniref:phage portal protein n=1 Tax=uncultured Maricaulis sp. TaxID=174710 RepID=UPI0030DA5E30|tara:strand:- start:138505 stop:140589 length:2085 start_codon:yes stop_codon:yes gene_type:complete
MLKALKAAINATVSWMRHAPDYGANPMRLLRRTKIDYRKEVGNGLDASVFTAPVQWIARALPEARLTVKRGRRDGVEEDLANHDLVKLVANPNAYYGDMALWMATVFSFCFEGNAYWVKLRNAAGRPVQLWYVPHWMMEPIGSRDGSEFLTHYRYSPGGGIEPIIISPDDVVHFRHGIDPSNPRRGLSPIDGVLREIFMDLEASNFVAALLRNMGVPGVVIAPKAGALPTADDVEATKTWFKQSFGGDKRGDPLVMGAPTDVHQFGFNPQQMNMDGARDVAEERICACLGVPAAVVGFGAGLQQTKVGATMESLLRLAWHSGVLPYCRMFADELSRSLLPDFGNPAGMRVTHDTSEVVALADHEDRETERWARRLTSGAVLVSEAREAWGLPVDDTHRIYLRPIASLEVPAGAPPRALPAPKARGEKARADASAVARASAYAGMVQRAEKGQIAKLDGLLKAFFTGLGAVARDAATTLLQADPTIAKARAADGEKADELLIEQILEALGIPAHDTTFRRLLEQHFLEVARTIADAGELAGISGKLPDPVARAIVAAGGRRAGLIDLTDQTRAALFDALAEGRAAGEGVTQLVNRIANEVEAGPWGSAETRARTIARTETKYAQNISTIERGRAAGVEHFVVIDGRLGPGRSSLSHMARNGSIVTAAEARQMADAEHPNGTLSFAPHFGGDDEED